MFNRILVMREIALGALTLAALAGIASGAVGLRNAKTPDGAYKAAILGALGIGGLVGSLLIGLL